MPELKKAFIGPYVNGHMDLEGRFYVPFNPAEISIEEAIGAVDVSGVDGREKQRRMRQGSGVGIQRHVRSSSSRQNSGMTTLSVTLFFNTLNDLYQDSYGDVREEIRRLYPYTNTTERIEKQAGASFGSKSETNANKALQLYFFWGSIAVAGTLTRMSVTYTMFAPDGTPVRARVSITIQGFYVGEETASEGSPAGGKKGGAGAQAGSGSDSGWRDNYRGSGNPRF